MKNLVSKYESLSHDIGQYHDVGKATPDFQKKIDVLDGDYSERKSRHSSFGATIAFIGTLAQTNCPKTATLAFLSVDSHHAPVRNIGSRVNEYDEMSDAKLSRLIEQYKSIASNKVTRNAVNRILPYKDITDDIYAESFENPGKLRSIYMKIQESMQEALNSDDNRLYQEYIMLYGALTFADKTSVAGLKSTDIFKKQRFSPETITEHINTHLEPPQPHTEHDDPETQLNERRERARQEVLQNIRKNDTHNKLYTIHLPTGFGKTLTAVSAAFEATDNEIVYALPRTSIINQTANTLADVFSKDNNSIDISESTKLTVHHYLSDTDTDIKRLDSKQNTETIKGYTPNELYAKTWLSDITLTTFVQLFETIAGPHNSQSMKLGTFHNKTIIIDEIQSLPSRWWGVITAFLETLIKEYNCTVISITATHPEIYNRNYCELNPEPLIEPEPYYNLLDNHSRVTFETHSSADKFMDGKPSPVIHSDLAEKTVENESQQQAIIANTISDARELNSHLKQKLTQQFNLNKHVINKNNKLTNDEIENIKHPVIANVTTRLRPIDRKNIIESLKTILQHGKEVYVTATQVFEAGVDISFNHIYRDICPASSIVQTAGRCNRELTQNGGTLTLVHIGETETDTSAKYVYESDTDRLNSINKLGFKNTQNTEKDITYTGVQKYFEHIFDSEDKTNTFVYGDNELIDKYYNGKGNDLQSDSIIDQKESFNVIIPRTESEQTDIHSQIEDSPYKTIDKFRHITVSIPSYTIDKTAGELLTDTVLADNISYKDIDTNTLVATSANPAFYTNSGVDTNAIGNSDMFSISN